MDFEWNEKKRLVNIKKHGFDFIRAEDVLDGTHVVVPSRREGNEPRFLAVGKIDGQFAAVVYTIRGDRYRIISIRSARHDERRRYQEIYG
jgi:hypothetical protein